MSPSIKKHFWRVAAFIAKIFFGFAAIIGTIILIYVVGAMLFPTPIRLPNGYGLVPGIFDWQRQRMHIINQKGETIVPENVTAFVWCDGVVYGERYRPKAWHDNSKQPEQVWFIYDANEIESRYLNPSNNRFYYGAEFQDRRDFEAEVVKRGLPPWDNGHVYFYEKLRWPGAKNLPSCINRNAASDYGKKP